MAQPKVHGGLTTNLNKTKIYLRSTTFSALI